MTLSDFDNWFRMRHRRTSSALTSSAFILSDIIGVLLSFGWGFLLIDLYGWIVLNYSGLINLRSFVTYWPYLPIFIVVFQVARLYPGIHMAPAEELKRFFFGSFFAYSSIVLARSIDNQAWDVINTAFSLSAFFSAFFLLIMRSITHLILLKTKLGGIPAVIYGSGNTARLLIDRMQDSVRTGYTPALILDDDPNGIDEYKGIPIIHDTNAGPEIVKRYNIKMAIVAMPELESSKLKILLNNSVATFRYTVFIPDFFNAVNIWMTVRDFDGVLGLVTNHRLKMPLNLGIKRFIDLFITIIGSIVLLPLFLVTAFLIKITSCGPVLYGHKRIGKNGKPFTVYKFRSMVIDAEERLQNLLASDPEKKEEWEKSHKLKKDPRVTVIGKILRRTSFDEFPQIINVLKGEMSLTGPRPVTEDEVEKYGENFNRIFSAKPGLTGLWQVSGRSDSNYVERIAYDTYYLQSWSVWLDIWILYKTFGAVIRGRGAY